MHRGEYQEVENHWDPSWKWTATNPFLDPTSLSSDHHVSLLPLEKKKSY